MGLKLTAAEQAAMGIAPASPKRKAAKGTVQPMGPEVFRAMLQAHGITMWADPEYEFAKPRKFRFDWAFLGAMVALECQGGIFSGGRHVRGAALLDEMVKLNLAAELGWRTVFCTPQQIDDGSIFETLRRVLR